MPLILIKPCTCTDPLHGALPRHSVPQSTQKPLCGSPCKKALLVTKELEGHWDLQQGVPSVGSSWRMRAMYALAAARQQTQYIARHFRLPIHCKVW